MTSTTLPTRFPYKHGEMISTKLPNMELTICNNPPGTKPIPYDNYDGEHSFGQLEPKKLWYLIWYVWEFIGHLWYLSYDFDIFIKTIAQNERADGPGKNDFKNYFVAMIKDSKSVYNRHILTHFDVMWSQCEGNQEMWNTKLNELRGAFNNYIKGSMAAYKVHGKHSTYKRWKNKLSSVYGDNWESYLWQCATFDELGRFIVNYNEYFKKTESAKEMLCHLQIPEETFNMKGYNNQKVAFIDYYANEPNSQYTIKLWVRGQKCNGQTYAYPATKDEWVRGGYGIIANYTNHTNIFPNGASKWLKECQEKGVQVSLLVMQQNKYTNNQEEDITVECLNNGVILCNNRKHMQMKIHEDDYISSRNFQLGNTQTSLDGGETKSSN